MYQLNSNFRYAGFWVRALAFILDHLILGFVKTILFIPLTVFLNLSFMLPGTNEDSYFAVYNSVQYEDPSLFIVAFIFSVMIFFVINSLIEWLYFAFFESSNNMATPGKMILGLKVTDFEGKRISFGKATGRYFAKFLSSMILAIGYIMAAFTERKQALHDILANCFVIYNDNYRKIEIPDDSGNNQTDYPKDYII
ncbi:MAG: RDD family protein [Rhodothermaceae bacterium]